MGEIAPSAPGPIWATKEFQDLVHQYALNAFGFILAGVALWFTDITPERLMLAAGFGLGGYGVSTIANNLRSSSDPAKPPQ